MIPRTVPSLDLCGAVNFRSGCVLSSLTPLACGEQRKRSDWQMLPGEHGAQGQVVPGWPWWGRDLTLGCLGSGSS